MGPEDQVQGDQGVPYVADTSTQPGHGLLPPALGTRENVPGERDESSAHAETGLAVRPVEHIRFSHVRLRVDRDRHPPCFLHLRLQKRFKFRHGDPLEGIRGDAYFNVAPLHEVVSAIHHSRPIHNHAGSRDEGHDHVRFHLR